MAASRDWNGRNAGTPSATVRPGPNVSRSVDTQSEIAACAGSDPNARLQQGAPWQTIPDRNRYARAAAYQPQRPEWSAPDKSSTKSSVTQVFWTCGLAPAVSFTGVEQNVVKC